MADDSENLHGEALARLAGGVTRGEGGIRGMALSHNSILAASSSRAVQLTVLPEHARIISAKSRRLA
jgi:hypothetical protein